MKKMGRYLTNSFVFPITRIGCGAAWRPAAHPGDGPPRPPDGVLHDLRGAGVWLARPHDPTQDCTES